MCAPLSETDHESRARVSEGWDVDMRNYGSARRESDGRVLRARLERQLVIANSVGPTLIVLYLVISGPFRPGSNNLVATAGAFASLAVALLMLVAAALWRARRA